jgi:hypothetical protein
MTGLTIIGFFIVYLVFLLFTGAMGFFLIRKKEMKLTALWGYIALGNIIELSMFMYLISILTH